MTRATDLDIIAPDDLIVEDSKKVDKQPVAQSSKKEKISHRMSKDIGKFIIKPKGFKLSECPNDEEVLMVTRPHWFTNIKWFFVSIFLFFVPFILSIVFSTNKESSIWIFPDILPGNFQMMASLFWYAFVFMYIFENFISWYFDYYIITDHRVIDIHFNNLLDKKFSEANIEVIQDVTSHISGVSQTIFNYGSVLIQTAGAVDEISFTKIPNPNRAAEIINELREELKHNNCNCEVSNENTNQ